MTRPEELGFDLPRRNIEAHPSGGSDGSPWMQREAVFSGLDVMVRVLKSADVAFSMKKAEGGEGPGHPKRVVAEGCGRAERGSPGCGSRR
jgi:hypothetical protein